MKIGSRSQLSARRKIVYLSKRILRYSSINLHIMEISKDLLEIATQETRKEELEENQNQDPTSKSPSLYTMANPNPPLPTFFYARDDDFTTRTLLIKSEVQAGQVSGHYLRIHGNRVSADAAGNNSKARFKMHCYYDDRLNQDLWIFESNAEDGKVIAIVNDRVVVKRLPTSGNSSSLTSIVNVKSTHPEILFVKKPLSSGSTTFTLRLYSTSPTRYYLGFDKVNGSAMVPSKVRPSQREAKFTIVN